MRRAYNSTIFVKERPCVRCGRKRPIFSRGRCADCARIEDTLARAESTIEYEEGLPELVKELDDLVSRYIRLKNQDDAGYVQCYTCDKSFKVADMQAGHYIPRGCMLLRFDIDRNLRCQCRECNEHKRGNLAEYGKRLELEKPGVTEMLLSESHTMYKYEKDELRSMISNYKKRIKLLKQ